MGQQQQAVTSEVGSPNFERKTKSANERKKSDVKKRWVGKIEFQVFKFRSRKVFVCCGGGRSGVRPRNGRRFESRVRNLISLFDFVFFVEKVEFVTTSAEC